MAMSMVNAATSDIDCATGTTVTISHEVVAGTRLLIVTASRRLGTFTSATYDGNALTIEQQQNIGGHWDSMIAYLLNPPVGTANLLVHGSQAGDLQKTSVQNWQGNAQSSLITGKNSTSWVSTTSSFSYTVTSAVGDVVVDGTCITAAATDWTETGGASIADELIGGSVLAWHQSSYRDGAAPTATVQYGGTQNSGTSVAASFAPQKGGNQAYIIASKMQKFYEELKRGRLSPSDLRKQYGELATI